MRHAHHPRELTVDPADEIRRLRSCINDLISVLALPAIWTGTDSSQVVNTLLDVLVGMLRLDLACVRLTDNDDGPQLEVVRWGQPRHPALDPQQVLRAIERSLAGRPEATSVAIQTPAAEGQVSIAAFSLGLQHEVGVLTAGSARPDFPTEVERLLLRVAANQAAIGLQEALRFREQKQVAEALEQRVAERTRQLMRVNDELRRSQDDLAHVSRVTTMGEMAASIAHEVDQPLSGVIINANACLRFLASESPNLDEVRDGLAAIARDGRRASEVTARIRALARRTSTEKQPLDINAVVREVVAIAEGEARRSGARIRTDLAPNVSRVSGDAVQLQQVVLNLLLNGLDAMSAVSDRARELIIRTEQETAFGLRVSVRDSGAGIDPVIASRIFTPFFTTKQKGLGMGLAISRTIIEQHGGQLWAAPNEGPGTTFYFTLALA